MFHIIVNPASSSGQGIRRWHEIEPLFRHSRKPYRVHFPSSDHSIHAIIRSLTADAARRAQPCTLVVLGGDGTLNEAVNAIVCFSNVRLGFVPVGSANDLARDIGLSDNTSDIVRQILKDKVVRTCDVGEVIFHNRTDADPYSTRRRLFNISCGIGYDAAICEGANRSGFKTVLNTLHLGGAIYVSEALRQIATAPMVPCKISDSTGRTLRRRRMLFTVIMNRRYEGGGFSFCPDADAQDGLLDLCMTADPKSRMEFFRLAPEILRGTHTDEACFTFGKAASFDIRTKEPLWVHTDGEVHCRSSHITVSLAKEKLAMLV